MNKWPHTRTHHSNSLLIAVHCVSDSHVKAILHLINIATDIVFILDSYSSIKKKYNLM